MPLSGCAGMLGSCMKMLGKIAATGSVAYTVDISINLNLGGGFKANYGNSRVGGERGG